MIYICPTCRRRRYWCRYCDQRHCKCSPHVSQRLRYRNKVMILRLPNGQTRTMAARRYAHLKAAQKGGQTSALRPNAGRFTSESARKTALKRWNGRHRLNKPLGIRLGTRRKFSRPMLDRRALRVLYSRAPRLGIRYLPVTQEWIREIPDMTRSVIISENTALRRLGHLPYARKNWVPDNTITIVTIADAGTARAARRKS